MIQTFEGNDCSGVFNRQTGFADCKIPARIDPNESPIIIKFDVGTGGGLTFEINSALFPTIDGSEFNFTGTGGASGTWTYTPGAGDPVIHFFVAKGWTEFNLFSNLGDLNSDDWFTPVNPGGQNPALSHRRSTTRAAGRCLSRRRYCCLAQGCLLLASLAGALNATDTSVFAMTRPASAGLLLLRPLGGAMNCPIGRALA